MSLVEENSGNDIAEKDDKGDTKPDKHDVDSGEIQPLETKKKPPRSERKRLLRQKKMEEQKQRRMDRKAYKKQYREEAQQHLEEGKSSESDNQDQSRIPDPTQLQHDDDSEHIPKRRRIELMKERQKQALSDGQKIAIDCSLEKFMSEKECSKLAQQLCRLYGQNRKSEKPAHLYFTGLNKSGYLYSECVRKNVGFENYMIDMTEDHHCAVFPKESIICLSPDSSNVLRTIEKDKVYIIGGLVDEHVQKGKSISSAEALDIKTAKLPLDEYLEKSEQGTFKKVLTVNQVFGILLKFVETEDWKASLSEWVPARYGFKVKSDFS